METRLRQSKTMVEFVEELRNYYQLDNCKPSKMILTILINIIITLVELSPSEKAEAIKSLNLYDFLYFFAEKYDEVNDFLKSEHTDKLISKIKYVMMMTNCKKIK